MTITDTNYRPHGAGALMAYIGRDGNAIKDRTGRELSVGEQADFIDQSTEYEFTRQIIVSPERGDELSDRELDLRTRQIMRELTQDRPSVRYVYSVHRDTDHPHAHVVLTGTREDLYMDVEDIDRVRAQATENFREVERAAVRDHDRDHEAQAEAKPDRRARTQTLAELRSEPEPER